MIVNIAVQPVPLAAGFGEATASTKYMQSHADCLCSELLDLREILVHLGDHLSGAAGVGCKSSPGETEIVGGKIVFP